MDHATGCSTTLPDGTPSLIVTGNPNVGKSVIFQLLTGRYATVSNYPGTTVMVTRGTMQVSGTDVRVCDTPGINTLAACSEDELVARNMLLGDHATVVQVADAKNVARALALTLELGETGVPAVLDLNMSDEARERRMTIHADRLTHRLGIPVVQTIATQRWGLDGLRRAIPQARPVTARVTYPPVIATAAREMEQLLPPDLAARRAVALLWLAHDEALISDLGPRIGSDIAQRLARLAAAAQAQSAAPLAQLIRHARLRAAHELARQVTTTEQVRPRPWAERWGQLAMHRVWGVPILLGVLALMYLLVGVMAAQRGVGFLEDVVFGRYVIPAAQWTVHRVMPWEPLQALLIGEYGMLTMALPYALAIILPIVGMFFFCFGVIEDVGYLPRLAVMANRGCRLLGLNGKAVLPLVLGLGCDTMATMTARILDSRKDRVLVTLLLALGVPCSAQLGVIAAMLVGLPPAAGAIWFGVVCAVLIVVGQTASRLVPGDPSPFLYEIPPLRLPRLSNVLIKTLGRVEWYLKEAVPLFFLGTLLLFALDRAGVLTVLERWATPLVVGWLGLPPAATVAFLVGFLRRDFGAAGLFALQRAGALTPAQVVVSLVTITLFVPCVAQYFVMVKERGAKTATTIAVVTTVLALLAGGLVRQALAAYPVLS